MSQLVNRTTANAIPCLSYRDAPAAIEWLCSTFGSEKHPVVPNTDGSIAHAQFNFGNSMVMLGSVRKIETEFGRLMKQPYELGGAFTQSTYVVVKDADLVYAQAKVVGAKITMEIRNEDYGGHGISCCDLEGYLWSFGSYDPWAAPAHVNRKGKN